MKNWICKECNAINVIENKNCIGCGLIIIESVSFKKNLINEKESNKMFEYGVEDAFNNSKKDTLNNSKKNDKDNSTKSKPNSTNTYEDLTIRDWVTTLFIAAIPIVGFIMLFVWGFSDNPHPVRSKWAKASLIVFLIGLALWFLFFMIFAVSSMSNREYY